MKRALVNSHAAIQTAFLPTSVAFLIVLNVFILVFPLRYEPAQAFEVSQETFLEQVIPDDVFVSEVLGAFDEQTNTFAGTVKVVNKQEIPVSEVVLTMQLVINNRTAQIDQFTTNEEGVAEFAFVLDGPVPLWVEVLDIYGDQIDFHPSQEARLVWYSGSN